MREVLDRLERALAILLKAQQDLRMEPETSSQVAGSFMLNNTIESLKATGELLRGEGDEPCEKS
ncbi:hypothetical protein ES703_68475 [subsurface metagenome]